MGLAWSAVAAADPPTVTPVSASDLPAGVTARGDKLSWAMTFVDKNGANYVLVSTHEESKNGGPMPKMSSFLYVDDWVVPKTGKPHNLLPVRDFVVDCAMGDPTAKFHDDTFSVTDLNHDGIAELTFGYQLGDCRSDVRPTTYKVLLIENGKMYIFRGKTRVKMGGNGETAGGDFTPDPVEAKWPAAFFAHVKDTWAKSVDAAE